MVSTTELLIKGRISFLLCYLSGLHRIVDSFVQFIFRYIVPNVDSAAVTFDKISAVRANKVILTGRNLSKAVIIFAWLCV